jgi:glycine cleavage system transcriptional repressor
MPKQRGLEGGTRARMLSCVTHFVISAIGRDRPGIVAGMTGALVQHGANIEDSQMTILRGHFTMTLVVSATGDVAVQDLRAHIEDTAAKLELEGVYVAALSETTPTVAKPTQVVTVYGVDHPGIVHAVSSALATRDVNITDLQTRLVGGEEEGREPLYAMILEVVAPPGLGEHEIESALATVRREQGVEVAVRAWEGHAI